MACATDIAEASSTASANVLNHRTAFRPPGGPADVTEGSVLGIATTVTLVDLALLVSGGPP